MSDYDHLFIALRKYPETNDNETAVYVADFFAEIDNLIEKRMVAMERQEPRQPLTDEQICDIALPFVNSYSDGAYGIHEDRVEAFARAIERAHGIVNE